LRFVWLIMVVMLMGCSPESAPGAETAPPSAETVDRALLVGELHDGGRRHRVLPLILHPATMDFRVGCLVERDRAQKSGAPARPLCFDEDRRPKPPTKLRIEYRLGMEASESMRRLMAVGEAAHFVVEATGTLYQVLDLAHGARRDGAFQQGEVRVLSGNTGGSDTLVEILKSHYGTLEIEQIDLTVNPSPTAPKPGPAPGTEP
jgi:hypothetical protein